MDFANKLPERELAPACHDRSHGTASQWPTQVPWPAMTLAVVGPTATGKSGIALALAQRLAGEIVNADAFQCYQHMALGTAQPSQQDMQSVPHHLYGHLDSRATPHVADYVQTSWSVLQDIIDRNHVPIVCGGTGLYLRSLRFGLSPLPQGDKALRQSLWLKEQQHPGCSYQALQHVDPLAASQIDRGNVQRIIRALEVWHITGQPISHFWQAHQQYGALAWPMLVLYCDLPDALLRQRFTQRIDKMWQQGWLEEVQHLQQLGLTEQDRSMMAIGYRQVWQVANQTLSWPQARADIIQQTWQLIRRQRTWFRKEPAMVPWQPHWAELPTEQLKDLLYKAYRQSLPTAVASRARKSSSMSSFGIP